MKKLPHLNRKKSCGKGSVPLRKFANPTGNGKKSKAQSRKFHTAKIRAKEFINFVNQNI